MGTYAIENVKDDAHGDAELLKVEVAVVVDICQIPYTLELVVPKAAVLQHRSCLLACEVLPAIGSGREDVPVCLNLLGFYARRHRLGLDLLSEPIADAVAIDDAVNWEVKVL
jgi:hypothetical protein